MVCYEWEHFVVNIVSTSDEATKGCSLSDGRDTSDRPTQFAES